DPLRGAQRGRARRRRASVGSRVCPGRGGLAIAAFDRRRSDAPPPDGRSGRQLDLLMRRSLLDILVDPISKGQLRLVDVSAGANDDVQTGALANDERRYAITASIPRFVEAVDDDQGQTSGSFGYKWQRRSSYDSPAVQARAKEWLVERYGFGDAASMTA